MYGAFDGEGFVAEVGTFTNSQDALDNLNLWLPEAVDPEDYNNFYISKICSNHEWSNGDTKYEDATECWHSDSYEMPYDDPRPIEFLGGQ